jgi:hypothetical protein
VREGHQLANDYARANGLNRERMTIRHDIEGVAAVYAKTRGGKPRLIAYPYALREALDTPNPDLLDRAKHLLSI